eukprot:403336548
MNKRQDMFTHRQEFLKTKYQQKNANQESGNDSFNMHMKDPLNPTDLQNQTQEEIFQTLAAFKKPLNFMNYSTNDYDLINNLPTTDHITKFFDKRVDYQNNFKEVMRTQYIDRMDNQLRIQGMTHSKYKEEQNKIQERMRKLKSHIIKNIQQAKVHKSQKQSLNRTIDLVQDKSNNKEELRSNYTSGLNSLFANLFSKNNKKMLLDKHSANDYIKQKSNSILQMKRNSALPIQQTPQTFNEFNRDKLQNSQNQTLGQVQIRDLDQISLMGERKAIKKHQFTQEDAIIDKTYNNQSQNRDQDNISVRSRLTKSNLEQLQRDKNRKDMQSQMSRIGNNTLRDNSEYVSKMRSASVMSHMNGRREPVDKLTKLTQPLFTNKNLESKKVNQDTQTQIGSIPIHINDNLKAIEAPNAIEDTLYENEDLEEDLEDQEELQNRYEGLDEVKSLNDCEIHTQRQLNDQDETKSVFSQASQAKSIGEKSKFSEKSIVKITKLERQLDKERKEREKLMKIIEDLKERKITGSGLKSQRDL